MNRDLLSSTAQLPTGGPDCVDAAGERFLSTSDLARRWGRSMRTLEGWRHRRQGPPYIRLNRLVVYRLSDIVAFETAWRIDPSGAATGGAGDGVR